MCGHPVGIWTSSLDSRVALGLRRTKEFPPFIRLVGANQASAALFLPP